MKKYIILSILSIIAFSNIALASVNPSDKYKKKVTYPPQSAYKPQKTYKSVTPPKVENKNNPQNVGDDSKKAQLDALARQMLKAGENHEDITPYQKKFMSLGVTEICPPQIVAKRTPTCPPVKIQVNGEVIKGSKCAVTCYRYNGVEHEVGYCKN